MKIFSKWSKASLIYSYFWSILSKWHYLFNFFSLFVFFPPTEASSFVNLYYHTKKEEKIIPVIKNRVTKQWKLDKTDSKLSGLPLAISAGT